MRRNHGCARLTALLLALALAFVLSPPARAAQESTVRVLLTRLALTDRLDATLCGAYALDGGSGPMFQRGSEVTLVLREGRIVLYYEGMTLLLGDSVTFTRFAAADGQENGLRFAQGGNLYEGDLRVSVSDGTLRAVLSIDVEDYLLGVIPYEMGDDWPLEALKAQAVAARTYALRRLDQNADYDLVDNTNDQVFRGKDAANTRAAQAVAETRGVCGYDKNALAECFYSASNGGQTEVPAHVWGAGDYDYLQMTADPYDVENPESVVKRAALPKQVAAGALSETLERMILDAVSEQLEALGYVADPQTVRVAQIRAAGVHTPKYEGSAIMTRLSLTVRLATTQRLVSLAPDEEVSLFYAPQETTAAPAATATPQPAQAERVLPQEFTAELPLFPDLEGALLLSINGGENEIVTVTEENAAFVLEARRYGHGVGLSQRGAQQMAQAHGFTWRQILAFYYPGLTFQSTGMTQKQLATLSEALLSTPGPRPTATPRPTPMPVTGPLPEGAWYAVVDVEQGSTLNLRAEPSLGGKIVRQLLYGQRLMVLERLDDGWVRVKTDVLEGYVVESYLRAEEAAAQ